MALPKYADKDLVVATLLMGGMSADDIATRFERYQNDPQRVLDSLSDPTASDSTRKLAKLVTGYISNPGTGHLTELLKNAGIDENTINQAIYNVQGPNKDQKAATPVPEQILASINQLGGGNLIDTVNQGLQRTGAGRNGITTSREQYLYGAPPPPAAMTPHPPSSIAPAPGIPTPDKIGPHPGAAAVAQTQANVAAKRPPAGTTPAGAGAPAPGGGGPNNTPTIDNPANWDDEKVKTWLKQNLGNDAWFIDIPDVWTAMKAAVKGGKGTTGADAAFKATPFYLQSSSKARLWYQYEREDSGSAAHDVALQTEAVSKMALDAGITLDPTRAQQMAQSYLRYGWSQADLQQAIGAEWHYDPSTKNQAAAVTQMKTQAQDWLVPLSDQAIQTWGQGLISGTVTQDQYTQYLRDNAKSLMPQLSTLIDQHAGDANFTVSTFADPYKQHAATLLGIQPDQINLNDSKWRQALDTVDPKTGERRIMTLGEWESKLKTDKSFGYDNTANGIKDGLALADSLKTSMGY